MTKREKFFLLLKGQLIEQTLFYPILMHFAARFNKCTYGQLASDYKVLVESNIKCLEYFDLDMVSVISDPYRETSAFGAPIEYLAEGVPKCLKKIIVSSEDVQALKIPDVYKQQRTMDRINGVKYYKHCLKDEVPIMGWVEGPLAEACDLAGVSEMLVNLLVDPEMCKNLLDKCLDMAKLFAKAQVDVGADLIGVGDAICSQIDSNTYNTFVFERHKELVDYIHSLGVAVKFHICGDTTHIWPSLAKLGIDIFDPDHMTNMEKAFEILGPNVIRSGNLNPVDVQNMSAAMVFEKTKQLVNKEKGRKFIMSAGCEICVDTPHDNLMAMKKALK